MPRPERGFTLVEVMVALTLGATLVLAAHATFGGATDAAAALARAQAAHESEMAGRLALAHLVANLDAAGTGSVGFSGGPETMRFSTRVREGDGTFVLHAVRIGVVDAALTASRTSGPVATLPNVAGVTFDYLLEGGADARWVAGWHSPVSAPLAVRMRLQRTSGAVDTLLLKIGVRG